MGVRTIRNSKPKKEIDREHICSILIAACLSKPEARARCALDGATAALRAGASSSFQQPDREPCCFVCAQTSGFWLMVYPRYARPKAHRTRAP